MKSILLLAAGMLAVSFSYSQNVGIGTPAPETKLHVVDTFDVADGASGAYINVQNATLFSPNGTISGIRFKLDGVNSGVNSRYKGGILFEKTSSFGVGSLHFATNSLGNNNSITTADVRMTINSIGNVGIGTTSPVAKLDVKTASTSSANSAFMLRNSNNDTLIRVRDNGYVGIGYNGPSYGRPLNIEGGGMNFYYNVSTYGGSIFPGSDGAMNMWAPSSSINLQPTTGAVTIGTYTPATGYLLSIDGKLICEEARVQLSGSWPDYVFNEDYKLRPLDELETIIKNQKHLPNIPPAAQVEKEGIDLGGMNKKLIEKIEELTLYVIDLNKKYNELNEDNKLLKAEINQLKTGKQ